MLPGHSPCPGERGATNAFRLLAAPICQPVEVARCGFGSINVMIPYRMEPYPTPNASLVDLVETVRALSYGRPSDRSIVGMLREQRGTSSTKHLFLARALAEHFPETQPQIFHRVYEVNQEHAASLFGEEVARVIPGRGLIDVHRYLTAVVADRRIVIDATFPGTRWDGQSSLPLSCGPGRDYLAGEDPDAEKQVLKDAHCDSAARESFILALSRRSSQALSDESIWITPYDLKWPISFELERIALDEAIGRWAIGGIHHVGSTAVPGLGGRPIIDILVGTESLADSLACFGPLIELDYLYSASRPEQMHRFCKPHPGRCTHHLHLVPVRSVRYSEELALRDILRANSQIAIGYAGLKRDLGRHAAGNREYYAAAKTELIRAVLDRSSDSQTLRT